jgi:hypothetical protein
MLHHYRILVDSKLGSLDMVQCIELHQRQPKLYAWHNSDKEKSLQISECQRGSLLLVLLTEGHPFQRVLHG